MALSRGAALLAAALGLAACHRTPVFRGASDITGVPWGGAFTLTNAHGVPFDTATLKGKVVLLYFGYIRCTDVCVPTLHRLGALMSKLGRLRAHTVVLFVSVDPHDTPARLRHFLDPIDPDFVGLTGTPRAVARVRAQFRVAAERNPKAAPSERYAHSDGLYIEGPHGRVRLYAPATISASDLHHDIRALLP